MGNEKGGRGDSAPSPADRANAYYASPEYRAWLDSLSPQLRHYANLGRWQFLSTLTP